MKILFVTSEWPTKSHPNYVPFLKKHILSLENRGVSTVVYKIKSKSMGIRITSIIRLRNYINSGDFNILHTHWGYNALYTLGVNIPKVITFHGSDLNIPKFWNIRTCTIYLISKLATIISDYNIFVTKALARESLSKTGRASVIPMGINLRDFFPMDQIKCRKKINLPINKKLILFGGNSSQPVKRLELAQSTVELLNDDYELITIDYISHELIPFYLNACDVLLMTSFNEGSPMMIKEAIACNLPIISTDVGDVKELVDGIKNCSIIPDESPRTIASMIISCVKNKIRSNGARKMENYSLEVTSEKVLNIYKKILKKI